ncbi:YeeE/YedE thiosulfate transporter family protein [Rhodanobacter sp. DHB23]|uniref:YeeE/YedE family protein n=1 Tax=Rhodanobacter sp. DHB23 TaxID=2775923 RepID=UPI0031BAD693
MADFTPWSALGGGILIGLAALLLLVALGRIAGISGIASGLLPPRRGDAAWRLAFVLGLPMGAALWMQGQGGPVLASHAPSWQLALAGLLVGVGTRIGSGCTSGHGVCGLGRLSPRSMVAVPVFMATAMMCVYAWRHLLPGVLW